MISSYTVSKLVRFLRHSVDRDETYTVSPKNSKIVLSELRKISTNFDNFWHKDDQYNKNYVRCTHFSPHLTCVDALPCWMQMFQIVTQR